MMKEQNVRLHGMVLFLVVLTLRLVTDRLGILLVQHVTGAAQAAIVLGSQLIWLGAPLAVYLGIKRGKSVRFERVSPKVWLLSAALAAAVTFALTYLDLALRGIVMAASGRVAVKEPVGAMSFGAALLLIVSGSLLPAAGGELLTKSCLYESAKGENRAFACALTLILPLLLYQDIAYAGLMLCFGLCALCLYLRCRNVGLTGMFLALALLPNSLSGGRTWLPFDYRTSLSVEGELLNALSALAIALMLAAVCVALFGLIRKFTGSASGPAKAKRAAPRPVALRFEEGLALVLTVTVYAVGIVLNYLV